MPYEDAVRESLGRLYKEASGFQISIDIIIKLAKSLRLDTFLDTEDTPGVKRLSIAGLLLLLEIDFKDDHTVVNVSLSLGNHTLDLLPELEIYGKFSQNIISDASNFTHGGSVVLSLLPETRPSFLRTYKSDPDLQGGPKTDRKAQSNAERILLASLSGTKLGLFPANLKYLADLDRVSPPEGDLIIYMDNLATYLAAIHHVEQKVSPDNWEITEGYTSSFGKVVLNDEATNSLGVFLHFWQDTRHLSRHAGGSGTLGTHYTALLAIEEAKAPAVDYLAEAKPDPWTLQNASGEGHSITFTTSSELAHLHNQQSVCTNSNWRLVLRFNEAVYLPQNILEYLGIEDYEEAPELQLSGFWSDAAQHCELSFKHENTEVKFDFSEISPYKRLRAISLTRLHLLPLLMAALRNQIVFEKLLESVALAPNSEYCVQSSGSISQETKTKIRETLQLSSDVPDEELIGLSTLSNDYLGVQMLDRDLDLETDENGDVNMDSGDEGTENAGKTPFLVVSFEEIAYGNPALDFVCRVAGKVSDFQGPIDAMFRIQNGQILAETGEDDMDVQMDASRRFTQGLAMGEDVLLALEIVTK